MVEVTQEDREAAAEYVRDNQQPRLERNVRAGKAYTGLSEAFARHRIAARKQALEEAAGVANARSDACDKLAGTHHDYTARYHNECRAIEARHISTAIRALSDSHVDQD